MSGPVAACSVLEVAQHAVLRHRLGDAVGEARQRLGLLVVELADDLQAGGARRCRGPGRGCRCRGTSRRCAKSLSIDARCPRARPACALATSIQPLTGNWRLRSGRCRCRAWPGTPAPGRADHVALDPAVRVGEEEVDDVLRRAPAGPTARRAQEARVDHVLEHAHARPRGRPPRCRGSRRRRAASASAPRDPLVGEQDVVERVPALGRADRRPLEQVRVASARAGRSRTRNSSKRRKFVLRRGLGEDAAVRRAVARRRT